MRQINAWRRAFAFGLGIASGVLLSGCKGYQVTLNETVVRSPAALYTDFQVTDRNLQTCLDQAIKDAAATAPGQLTQLNCSHAGIETLEGLQVFHNLQQINLAHNQLRDLKALGQMGRVQLLLLNHNKLKSIPEVLTLPKLNRLELDNNPELHCGDIQQLQQSYNGRLQLPEHCR